MGAPTVVLGLLLTGCVLMTGGQVVGNKESVAASDTQAVKQREGIVDAVLEEGKCYGRKCINTEQCCRGTACVDVEGDTGTCLPVYSSGAELSRTCLKDSECGEGWLCGTTGTCFPARTLDKKGFNDECLTSADCDVERNLCCQVMRRHRMAPKRLCYYFIDPKSCLGEIRTDLQEVKYIPNPFFKARLG